MANLPNVPFTLNTSDNDLVKEFYEPSLSWAKYYDRGVGYFTSGWLKLNARGMSIFASNGGRARWITSPILDKQDANAIEKGLKEPEDIDLNTVLKNNIEQLNKHLSIDTLNTLAWMIYDKIIEFRFAIPINRLEDGDFHDKFGIFYDDDGNRMSFNGSVNDSKKGIVNYESLKIFKSWSGLDDFVKDDLERFERLWNKKDENLKIFKLPEAVKEQIFKLRTSDRPYKFLEHRKEKNKWHHQDEAADKFLSIGHGILEMATGTGKTRTAIKIINKLYDYKKIESVIVTMNGTDLLDQWYENLAVLAKDFVIYRHYSKHKRLPEFLLNPKGSILLISRNIDFLGEAINHLNSLIYDKTLFIGDEVHGFGSSALVKSLSGKIRPFHYRLGLSATPEREYDQDGNRFISNEIGNVIFQFGLDKAIRKGVICELDYFPLFYNLTDADRLQIHKLIASFNARKKFGKYVDETEFYRNIALVRKTSLSKLPLFENLLINNPSILDRSIIFVETEAYGINVQNILLKYLPSYHTYYADDDKKNLLNFSNGNLSCLITCKRISEGIDIKSLNTVIIFSSDRAKLQTIQRIGRCLRIDPINSKKRAKVVDFICEENIGEDGELTADEERMKWLEALSTIRREINE